MAFPSKRPLWQKHTPFILLVLVIVLPVFGFLVGVSYEKQMLYKYALLLPSGVNPEEISQGRMDEYAVKKNCPYYDLLDKKLYLPSYTVKKGDSLLSIAAKQLGSSDRITFLVALNQDRYRNMTVNSPFVEVGWTLYLPPPYLPNLTYDIHAFAGEYAKTNASGTVNIYTPTGGGPSFNPADVIFPYDESIQEGDCVVVLTSMEPGKVKDKAVFLQKQLPKP